MEAIARKQYLRISPRKLRLVVDVARGKNVQDAIDSLRFSNKKMADEVVRLIRSAVNNATQNQSVDVDKLIVKKIFVDGGPIMKRILPRARGSADRIMKRMSHVTVVVDEAPKAEKKKSKGKK